MASNTGSNREEDPNKLAAELGIPLKQGERIVGPTRRPDGTLRKPIRIRAGYVPQEEVAIYQSKGTLLRKEMESQSRAGPPGYDPETDSKSKPKSKSVKRNERKKEKRQQASLEKVPSSDDATGAEDNEETDGGQESYPKSESVDSVASQMSHLGLYTAATEDGKSSSNSTEGSTAANPTVDIDKKIRALKKKIRLTEAQLEKAKSGDELKPEQLEKVKKLEGWHNELKLLETQKAAESSASTS